MIIKGLFSSQDDAQLALSQIYGRYSECVSADISSKTETEKRLIGAIMPYQAYSGSVSTGGEMPMIPFPAVIDIEPQVQGECTLMVQCFPSKKEAVRKIMRAYGALSVETEE